MRHSRGYRDPDYGQGIRIKPIITLLAVVFVIALAVVIGTRMSSDAIAILVGVIAGVAASVPTALLLIVVTKRREEEYVEPYEEQRPAMPPVIVVAPNAMPQAMPPYGSGYGQQMPMLQQPRRFRVMGYEDEEPEPAEADDETTSWYQ